MDNLECEEDFATIIIREIVFEDFWRYWSGLPNLTETWHIKHSEKELKAFTSHILRLTAHLYTQIEYV